LNGALVTIDWRIEKHCHAANGAGTVLVPLSRIYSRRYAGDLNTLGDGTALQKWLRVGSAIPIMRLTDRIVE
jgi:hypothetical protein